MTHMQMYLWTRLDAVGGLAQAVAVLTFMGAAISLLLSFDPPPLFLEKNEEAELKTRAKGICKRLFAVAFVACAVAVLLPSKRDAAMIYVVPKLDNSEVIKRDIPDIYNMAIERLKNELAVEK